MTSWEEHGSLIGAQSVLGFDFIVKGLLKTGLVEGREGQRGVAWITLTFPGWQRYEALRRGAASGRNAFIAMEYNDPLLDRIVDGCFRPALVQTGFTLRRLDDEPTAGLIDDRLRVAIQSARFLIADLSHQNRGAYWEAGYAEGLGKPVIYTCEESKFRTASHFDTNHHLTVMWTEGQLEKAASQLKATIRFTIPDAKREDD